jgi:hypothetical protein
MFVSCECCVLSGRGLCDELITRPEESYRMWCVVVCDLETSRMRRPWPALGHSATEKKSDLEIMWKKAVVSWCVEPFRRVLRGTECNHEPGVTAVGRSNYCRASVASVPGQRLHWLINYKETVDLKVKGRYFMWQLPVATNSRLVQLPNRPHVLWFNVGKWQTTVVRCINSLQTKRRPLYLKTQSVPRCKHFSSRL